MASDYTSPDRSEGAGWLTFAGIMVLIVGILNTIWGIAAIDKASFFVEDSRFIVEDLQTWGWVVLIVGVIQLFAAFSIWSGNQFGRWVGIIGASLSAISAMMSIPGFPLWSLAVLGLSVLVIYGLTVYGGQHKTA